MTRITQVSALTLLAACWLGAVGCSSSNEPATNTGSSGSTSTPTSSAGTGTVVTPEGGGTSTSEGGSPGVGGSTAIAGSTGNVAGGATVSGGSTGAGGSTSGSAMFTPLCSAVPVTAAGVAPTKAGACTATDTQLCYKTCGPQSVGFKSETCTNGAYVEQSGCSFPSDLDASCYKIPTTIDASCPTTPPMASTACTVAACTLCNVGGNYLDSTGASKAGYCVCPAPGTAGTSKWSCASSTAWPCPNGMGC
jgi:hypothetical protein